ncbi:MAG: hypothetical protein H7X80_10100, partial [bacterium]|nr:hypothetical protein [Candidatus Kapabacteria bacterium]
GKLQRLVDPAALPQEALANDSALQADPLLSLLEFHRNVYSFRLGYGQRHGNYVALTGLYSDDDEQSVTLQDVVNRPVATFVERLDSLGEIEGIDTVFVPNHVVGRQLNYGAGAIGRLEFESTGLVLDGEFNLSWFDDAANRRGQLLIPRPQALPSFLESDSMLTDFNYALRSTWELPWDDAGVLNAGIRYVGGGFRSIGVTGLRTDILRADARYNTTLLDRQVRAGLRYSFEEAGYKDSSNSSVINALGASVEIRPRGFPVLTLGYQRHSQSLETSKRDTALHQITDNAIEEITATLTSLRQWSDIRWSLFASGMIRNGSSKGTGEDFLPDSAGVFGSNVLQMDNRIAFGNTVTFGLFTAYTGTRSHPIVIVQDSTGEGRIETLTEESDNYNIDISALIEPMRDWQMTFGAVATYQDSIATPAILGGYISSRLGIGEWAAVELRFDYRESARPDFEGTFPVERVGRIITTVKW